MTKTLQLTLNHAWARGNCAAPTLALKQSLPGKPKRAVPL